MATELEKMRVVVEAKTSDFKKKVDEVKKEAHKAADAADKELGKVGSKAKGIKSFRDKVNSIKTAVKSLVGAARLDGGMLKPTKEFSNLTDKIEQSRKRIEVLKKTIGGLNAKGFSGEGAKAELADEESKYAGMMQQAQGMFDESMANGGEGPAFEVNDSLSKIDMLKGAIQGIKSVAAGAFQGFKDAHPVLGRVLSATGKVASTIGKIGITAGKVAFAGVKKLASGIKGLFSRAHAGGSRGLLGGIARMIAGLYLARRALMFLVNGLKEGMNNLAQYSKSTNGSLSMLKSSLTQCKNALATAFAPVLNAVAPLLNTLINWVTAAATALAHFFSALTGQKQTTIARKVNQDYAEGLNNTADSANNAADANEKYKRSLMGFDKINKLEDNSKSKDNNNNNNNNGLSPSDMFDTVDVSSSAIDWANKFKEAWENADFTEIGNIVGTKLKKALDSIDWDGIKNFANKIAKSIATFLNGFLETEGLFDSVGTTIAEALNTAFGAANTFATVFHWDSLGRAVSDTINAFFKKFQFDMAAATLSNIALGILEFFTTAIDEIKWDTIGASIIEFITSIKWVDLFVSAVGLLDKVRKGFVDLLKGAIEGAVSSLSEWISSGKVWEDLFKVGKAVLDFQFNAVGDTLALLDAITKGTIGVVKGTIKYTAKKVGKVWGTIKTSIKGIIKYASKKASGWMKGIKTKLNGAVTYASKKASGWLKNISRKLKGTVTFAANWAKDALKKLQQAAAKAGSDKFFTWGFRGKSPGKRASGGIYKSGSWHPVTAAANGGAFDQGQMFVAREAGPELVGTIGNHTAVVNNDQIVASVSDGVARAVASVMSKSNNGTVNVTLQGDASKFFKVIREQATNYTMATGRSAFPV